jgi:hypothetical protein
VPVAWSSFWLKAKKMSKQPPIVRIRTLRRPVPERKSNELLAVGFATDAEAYIGAAQQLESFRSFGRRYFLFCHALELLLKAQILATGADQEELFEIRHDLEKAYGRAIELGYTPADDRVKQIVVWLAPYHGHPRSISQNVNLSKLLLNSLNAPRAKRVMGSTLRTRNGHPALVGVGHDSDRHFRRAIVERFQLLVKNPTSSVLEILILAMLRFRAKSGFATFQQFSLSNL